MYLMYCVSIISCSETSIQYYYTPIVTQDMIGDGSYTPNCGRLEIMIIIITVI